MQKRKAQSPIENHNKAQKKIPSTMPPTLEDIMKKLEKLDKLDSIEKSVKEIEINCEDIKVRLNKTEVQTEENTGNIEVLQTDVEVLLHQMNQIQYDKIRHNIIIHGVPIAEGENTHSIALLICNTLLNIHLDPSSLYTRRMPIRNLSPPIIIKFVDPTIKSTILKNWKTLNSTSNTKNIQQKLQQLLHINPNSKISIIEEQTQYSHKLLKETKSTLGNKFKFIWIKFGNIYIRQKEDSLIHKIQTRHQLKQFVTFQEEEPELTSENPDVSSY